MARKRPTVKKKQNRHAKTNDVLVALSDQDYGDLTRAAQRRTEELGEVVGRGTLLRQLAMPLVREILNAAPAAASEAA